MTTTVKVFKSTDSGAPVLAGTAGSLLAVLNAVLVNGYNSKPISVTQAAGIATATVPAHGYLSGQCLLIAGAEQADYNGEQFISVVDANTFTFPIAESTITPATGSLTAKLAPAGWSSPFMGTNKAVYRMGGGNQRFLRVDDAGTTQARVVGYEAMTTVDVGTGDFPTSVQFSGGLYINKSSVADTSTRQWVAMANDRLLHLWINAGPSVGLICGHQCFGDSKSFAGGDQFNTLLIAQTSYSASAVGAFQAMVTAQGYGTALAGHYMARGYTQTGGAVPVGKHADAAKMASLTAMLGGAGLPYPNAADGGLYLSPLFIHEAGAIRGIIPGVWAPLHARPFGHMDTINGSGVLADKVFLALNAEGSSAAVTAGQLLYETSNTWDL
jgi:hypothetical protein